MEWTLMILVSVTGVQPFIHLFTESDGIHSFIHQFKSYGLLQSLNPFILHSHIHTSTHPFIHSFLWDICRCSYAVVAYG